MDMPASPSSPAASRRAISTNASLSLACPQEPRGAGRNLPRCVWPAARRSPARGTARAPHHRHARRGAGLCRRTLCGRCAKTRHLCCRSDAACPQTSPEGHKLSAICAPSACCWLWLHRAHASHHRRCARPAASSSRRGRLPVPPRVPQRCPAPPRAVDELLTPCSKRHQCECKRARSPSLAARQSRCAASSSHCAWPRALPRGVYQTPSPNRPIQCAPACYRTPVPTLARCARIRCRVQADL